MQGGKFDIDIVKDCISFAREIFDDDSEPLPKFTDKEITKVVNCCNRIYMGYYKSFEEQLVKLAYNLCKGHYLHNGNKRITFILTLMFVVIENKKSVYDDIENKLKFLIDNFAQGNLRVDASNSKSQKLYFNLY